ncbi:unnamed protein product [Pieris macdunnoughi]|uniref:Uncharacterized protein n=1 Tax=Pieris macdunnoughi TaxID=345717 RepID=A0A821QPB4_9NEOP|nr:unnamed protein product [Pieris macdunnoughi]
MGWIVRDSPKKKETSNSGSVHVDCFISTQEQRPIENGTANVFLTSALTPGSASTINTRIRFSTFQQRSRVSNIVCVPEIVVFEMT